MTDRSAIDHLLRQLYAARVRGDLNALCGLFSADAKFQVAGPSHTSPIAVEAVGIDQFRPLLALMIKTFRLTNQEVLSILIDGDKAAVHWRANVQSRIVGTTVLTELMDMIEIRNGKVSSYVEFFTPR